MTVSLAYAGTALTNAMDVTAATAAMSATSVLGLPGMIAPLDSEYRKIRLTGSIQRSVVKRLAPRIGSADASDPDSLRVRGEQLRQVVGRGIYGGVLGGRHRLEHDDDVPRRRG